MSAHFSLAEVLAATGGTLVGSLPPASGPAFTGVSTDTRSLQAGQLFVALVGDRFDAHGFLAGAAGAGAALAVVQRGRARPGAPSALPLVEVDDTLVALGALARHHRRRFEIPLGAITGSNGKTSTKEMVAAILATRGSALKTQGNLNNEIGLPLTLFGLSPAHRSAVVELGMNHAGEIDRLTRICEPDAGLVTVVQAVHTEHFADGLRGVARAKGELFRALRPGATAVVNLDDPWILAEASARGGPRITFGSGAEADVQLLATVPDAAGQTLSLRVRGAPHLVPLSFLGTHNALNAAGAFALGLALGIEPDDCARGLAEARPHGQRLRLVPGRGGVQVLDDSYNANPGSMKAGLSTLGSLSGRERSVAVLGDMLELGEEGPAAHAELGREAARHARVVAFFGPQSASGASAATKEAAGCEVGHFADVDALISWLTSRLRDGDTVLVKGSRGMRLERVVAALTGAPAADGSH